MRVFKGYDELMKFFFHELAESHEDASKLTEWKQISGVQSRIYLRIQ